MPDKMQSQAITASAIFTQGWKTYDLITHASTEVLKEVYDFEDGLPSGVYEMVEAELMVREIRGEF